MGKYWKYIQSFILEPILSATCVKDIFLTLEKDGKIGRLDPNGQFPEIFKGPTIDEIDLGKLRSIKNDIDNIRRACSRVR